MLCFQISVAAQEEEFHLRICRVSEEGEADFPSPKQSHRHSRPNITESPNKTTQLKTPYRYLFTWWLLLNATPVTTAVAHLV